MRREDRQHRHSKGYIRLWRPNHPYRDKLTGYVYEHRLVMEAHLGHYINPKTHHVHHINGVKDDNRLENLMYVTYEEHRRIEFGWEKRGGVWSKPCTRCRQMLEVNEDNFFFRKNPVAGCGVVPHCKRCDKYVQRDEYRRKKEKGGLNAQDLRFMRKGHPRSRASG